MAVQRTLIGNIKGPKGDKGDTGDTGARGAGATVTIGNVTTTAYGGNANVTNSGTPTDAVLDFVLPQGAPGETVTDMQDLTLSSMTQPSVQFPTPSVGDDGKTLFGKITKWFSDMAALVATKLNAANVVNNLTTTNSGYALDARQGKALNDTIETFGAVRLYDPYSHQNINIDRIDCPNGYIYRVRSDIQSGTFPTNVGNAGLLIGFSQYRNNKLDFGTQIMLVFGGTGIYKRVAPFNNTTGSSWSTWTQI